jgi:hypothetical protein
MPFGMVTAAGTVLIRGPYRSIRLICACGRGSVVT